MDSNTARIAAIPTHPTTAVATVPHTSVAAQVAPGTQAPYQMMAVAGFLMVRVILAAAVGDVAEIN